MAFKNDCGVPKSVRLAVVAAELATPTPHSRLEVDGVGVEVVDVEMVPDAVFDSDSDTDAVCE